MRLHLPRRRLWRVAIYLGSFLLVVIAADMVLVQSRRTIRPGFATTRIISPLKEDGSIDYAIAADTYIGHGVTQQNNAAVLILQALGRRAMASYQADGVADYLGMPHLPETGDYFVTYDEYCNKHSQAPATQWSEATQPRPWPVEFDQITVDWVHDNEKPLELITQASKRSRFFIPFVAGHRTETMIEILLPHVGPLRDACRAFQTRALIRLSAGDVAGFHEDFLTIHRLTRLLGQSHTMIERIVAATVEISACEQQRVRISSGKIPADQARAMAKELAALGDLAPLVDILDKGERYFALDTLQVLAHRAPPQAGRLLAAATGVSDWRWGPPAIFMLIPIPYEKLMREVNRLDDEIVAAMREPEYPQREAAIKLLAEQVTQKDVKDLSLRDFFGTDWPAEIFVPAWLKAIQREETARMEARLTQIALSLSALKAERGSYPASLSELVPDYMSAVSEDLFVEKPLVYSRKDAGYTLRSVGPNMIDDVAKDGKPGDDLMVNMP